MIRSDILASYPRSFTSTDMLSNGFSTNPWVIKYEGLSNMGDPKKLAGQEHEKKFNIKQPVIIPLTGDKNDPIEVKLLFARRPELRKNLSDALNAGLHINLYREVSTPAPVRDAFQHLVIANGDLNMLTAEALVSGKNIPKNNYKDAGGHTHTVDIDELRKRAHTMLHLEIEEKKSISSSDNEALTDDAPYNRAKELASFFQQDPDVNHYQAYRLVTDRRSEETEKVGNIIFTALKIGAGASILEGVVAPNIPIPVISRAVDGAGILVSGSSDDIGNALGNTETKNGGKSNTIGKLKIQLSENAKSKNILKSIPAKTAILAETAVKFSKDNPLVAIAIGGAMALDFAVLPHLFESTHDLSTHLTAASLYWLSATAGSVASKITMVRDTAATIRNLDGLGELPGRQKNTVSFFESFRLAWKDNQSNPTRRGLFWGIGVSLIASLLAEGATTIDPSSFLHYLSLHGAPTSGNIQSGIGPAESLIAVAGTKGLVEAVDNQVRNIRSGAKLRRLTRKNSS